MCRNQRRLAYTLWPMAALFFASAVLAKDVDFTANVIANSCKVTVSNGGRVILGTVTPNYFAAGVTATTDYPGGQTFTLSITNCVQLSTISSVSQMQVEFTPQSGLFPLPSRQIFANDALVSGAQNVGVVIFSAQDGANRFNVLKTDGSSQAVYPVTKSTLENSIWTFYTRMQKIDASLGVTPGPVLSNVLVNVSYN